MGKKVKNDKRQARTQTEFQKFDGIMKKLLSVSHKELQAREQN